MYKKIIFRFTIFSIILFATLKLVAIYTFEYAPNYMATIWKLKSNISKNYDNSLPLNIIIGSSRTLSLNPKKIEILSNEKFINLSVPSAQIPYVYYTLKRIIDRKVKINSIYIDIPASNNMGYRESGGAFNQNFIRYFITKNELSEYKKYNKYSLESYKNTRKFGKEYVNKDLGFLIKGYIFKRNKNELDKNRLVKDLGYTLMGDPKRKSNKEESLKYRKIVFQVASRKVPEIQKIYLKKIIQLLSNSNVKYKFFFSPYPTVSTKLDNLGLGNYIELLRIIPRNNIDLKSLLLDEKFFIDGSHPNLKGSDINNRYFVQEILGKDLNEHFNLFVVSLRGNEK